jgi:hypothetical protein
MVFCVSAIISVFSFSLFFFGLGKQKDFPYLGPTSYAIARDRVLGHLKCWAEEERRKRTWELAPAC